MPKFLLAFAALAPVALAQTAPSQPTIEALLAEVRQLRIALERSAVLGPKMQLAAQRLSMQEQKIARIQTQLESVRRELGIKTEAQQRFTQQLALLEQRIVGETDPVRRKQFESEREHIKGALANFGVDPQLQARETELAGSLRTEQAVAQDLNTKLDAIERMLDIPLK